MGPVSTLRSINGSQAPSPNGPLRVAFFFQQSTQGQAGTELGWVGFFLLATAGFRFWALLNRFWDDDEHEIESSRSHFRADCGSRSPDWVVFFLGGGGVCSNEPRDDRRAKWPGHLQYCRERGCAAKLPHSREGWAEATRTEDSSNPEAIPCCCQSGFGCRSAPVQGIY